MSSVPLSSTMFFMVCDSVLLQVLEMLKYSFQPFFIFQMNSPIILALTLITHN